MIAFVTSLRHPANARDYERVEDLLFASLKSVAAQSDPHYIVIVVANAPLSRPVPRGVIVHVVDYPAPAASDGVHASREDFVRDKGTKIGAGLAIARDFRPDHVMIFDADDFVHRDLAAFVNARPDHAGWVIERGWMYSAHRGAARLIDNFHRTCGTSYVIPYSAYGVPPELSRDAAQDEVVEAYNEVLFEVMGAHREARNWYARHGRILEPFPFPAAAYQVDTAENHSRKTFVKLARPLPRSVAGDFGIKLRIPVPLAWWRSSGPRAAYESWAAPVGAWWHERRRGAARAARRVFTAPVRIIAGARSIRGPVESRPVMRLFVLAVGAHASLGWRRPPPMRSMRSR